MVKRHRDRRQGILPPSFWFCSPSIIKQMLPKYNSQVNVPRVLAIICQLGQIMCSKHLVSSASHPASRLKQISHSTQFLQPFPSVNPQQGR